MENQSQTSPTTRWWDLPAAFLLLVVLTAAFTLPDGHAVD
jgi:hypothetical protein